MDLKGRRPTVYIGTICLCLIAPLLLRLIGLVRPNLDDVLICYKVTLSLGAIGLFVAELKERLDARAPVLGLLGGALVVMTTYGATYRVKELPFDFQAYLRAGDAIAAGTDPYVAQRGGYLYPPLLAESVYLLRSGVDQFQRLVETPSKKHPSKTHAASPIFVLWSGLQILAAAVVYACGYRLSKRLGADELQATALPLTLLLANHAFWRTLNNGQINLFQTTIFFVAILCAAQRPFISGLAVAIGAHMKVYPMFLIGPWTLSGRWKITLYALLCFGVIFALQLTFFEPSIWQHYFHFAAGAPQQVRNESLATVSVISFTFGNGKAISFKGGSLAAILAAAVYATVLVVMAARFFLREKIWRGRHRELPPAAAAAIEDKFRIMGHGNDAIVLPLLISPIVWNHHYVVLLPVLIWSTLVLGITRLRSWLPVGALLFPFFDRPFIYIYYVGVWLLLYETSPRAIWDAVTAGVTRVPDSAPKLDTSSEPQAPPEGATAAATES